MSMSQVPTSPNPAWSAPVARSRRAAPDRPPRQAPVACVSSPAALTRSTARPAERAPSRARRAGAGMRRRPRHRAAAAGGSRRSRRSGSSPSRARRRPGPVEPCCSAGVSGWDRTSPARRDRSPRPASATMPFTSLQPAVAAALAAAPGFALRVSFGRDDGGHQTSRMIGSTTGLRRKRWLMSWRTAVRTRRRRSLRDRTARRGPRSASAASTAFLQLLEQAARSPSRRRSRARRSRAPRRPRRRGRRRATRRPHRPRRAAGGRAAPRRRCRRRDLPSTSTRPAGKCPTSARRWSS